MSHLSENLIQVEAFDGLCFAFLLTRFTDRLDAKELMSDSELSITPPADRAPPFDEVVRDIVGAPRPHTSVNDVVLSLAYLLTLVLVYVFHSLIPGS